MDARVQQDFFEEIETMFGQVKQLPAERERTGILQGIRQFVEENAERNQRGELYSRKTQFTVSGHGVVTEQDLAELAAHAEQHGIKYFHNWQQQYDGGRYRDSYDLKMHVLGDAWDKGLGEVTPVRDVSSHPAVIAKLIASRALNLAQGNDVTAMRLEREISIGGIKGFIEKAASHNKGGALSSMKAQFETSRHGVVSASDYVELKDYARAKGVEWYCRESSKEVGMRYGDQSILDTHVIGDAFGNERS